MLCGFTRVAMSLCEILESGQDVFVQQRKEWTEIVIDFETRNRYAAMDASGSTIGAIAEVSTGFGATMSRWFIGSHRALDIHVLEGDGSELLHLTRPFFLLFSSLEIAEATGAKLGRINRRFGIFYRKYDLLDEFGNCFGRIKAPRWRIWTFPVEGTDGISRAKISKKWGGAVREIFTDADTYRVSFEGGSWTATHRKVIFAAAISIDFDFFENNQGSGGLFSFMD